MIYFLRNVFVRFGCNHKSVHIFREKASEVELPSGNMTESGNNNNETETETDSSSIFSPSKGTFYFGHSPSILPFLTLLGINKDDYAFTHDNYEEAKER